MNVTIDLSRACESPAELPSIKDFRQWSEAAISAMNLADTDFSLGIHLVDEAESARLNRHYRDKAGPTNILSFPASQEVQLPPGEPVLLGDLALCIPVLEKEARLQHKPLASHFAHLTVHGVLHLKGHDHEEEAGARRMEQLEIDILGSLGFADPYATAYTATDK